MTPNVPTRGGAGAANNRTKSSRISGSSNRSELEFREVLERTKAFFHGRETVEGVVARRVLDATAPGDGELADHLIRERRRKSRMDGSIGGSLIHTAHAAWDLMELGAPPDHAAVVRMTGYLLTRQNLPGRWSDDGIAGDGFFSPGDRQESVAPLELPSGIIFRDEEDARFVASCLALRAVLRAGHENRAPVAVHLDSLLAIRAFDPHLAFVVLGALAMAPPSYHERLQSLVDDVAARQAADGTWPDVTIFHAMDMLLSVPSAAARALIRKAAPHIASLQQPDGAFDPTGSEAIALIAVRALDTARSAV